MQQQTLYIKGMVCERCIQSVSNALESLGLQVMETALGEVTVSSESGIDLKEVEKNLQAIGFSLLTDKRVKLVTDIKNLVAKVYSGNFDFPDNFRFSTFLSDELGLRYDVLAEAFSSSGRPTIEKYISDFRVEKIKEALVYTDQTIADIAYSFGFSSAAHLSRQFKLHTGLTPSYFKTIRSGKTDTSRGSTLAETT